VAPEAESLTFLGALRPYQQAVVDAATATGSGGVIVAPTGSGKTCIGCALMASHDTPALVLVHSRDLADQWVERVRDFLGVEAGIVGYGKRKKGEPGDEARVVIASLQTLARWSWWKTHGWGQRFGVVIQDEAHHAPAATYLRIMHGLAGRFRYGLTATPERMDGLSPWMTWSLGEVVAEVDHRELEDSGAVLKPRIRWWQAPAVDLEDMEAHERAAKLADDDGRNGGLIFEARLLVEQNRVVLMLVKLVDHAHQLAEGLQVAGVRASALVGDVKPKERAAILGRMRSGDVDVVVATSLADEGLDAPRVDTVVLTEPTRNVGRVLQRIGRALRPHEDGQEPLIVDVVDTWGPYRGYAKAREKVYRGRGWL
jgi:superfamily II DNA or RNA helicase